MDLLNNRETAALAWALILLTWALTRAELRESFANVIKHAFADSLVKIYAAMLVYVTGMLVLLSIVGLWDVGQLKATIVWIFSITLISLFRAESIHDDPGYFKKSVRDNINLIVVLEFLVGFYSFSFFSEFILLPVVTFLGMAKVYSEGKPEY